MSKNEWRDTSSPALDVRLLNPASLSGVWAEENTRASLFDAMKRKETFATSGPWLKVRFFGGWKFDKTALDGSGWVKAAYAAGVPMGGDLPSASGKAPSFVVWAIKDPDFGESRPHSDRQGLVAQRTKLRARVRRRLGG